MAAVHFGCDEVTGIPIEDEGTAGSVGSHWEITAMGNEV